jgi:hypothetical protein
MREKFGALVPKGNIVEAVLTMTILHPELELNVFRGIPLESQCFRVRFSKTSWCRIRKQGKL